jgi:hypothetical protein
VPARGADMCFARGAPQRALASWQAPSEHACLCGAVTGVCRVLRGSLRPGPAHAARRRARRQAAGGGGAGRAARAAGQAGGRARARAALLGAGCGRPAAGPLGHPPSSCTTSHDTRHGHAPIAAARGRGGAHGGGDGGRGAQAGCSTWRRTRARASASRRCTTTCWRCCGRGARPPRAHLAHSAWLPLLQLCLLPAGAACQAARTGLPTARTCEACARRMPGSVSAQRLTAGTAMGPGRACSCSRCAAARCKARMRGAAAGGVQGRVLEPNSTLALHRQSGWTRCRRAGSCRTARTTTRRARCAACSSRLDRGRWTPAWPPCARTRPRCARWPPSSASTPRRAAQRRARDSAPQELRRGAARLHGVTPGCKLDELQRRPPPQVPAWPVERRPGLRGRPEPHAPALPGACERWVRARGRRSSGTRPPARPRAPRTRTRRPQRCAWFRAVWWQPRNCCADRPPAKLREPFTVARAPAGCVPRFT